MDYSISSFGILGPKVFNFILFFIGTRKSFGFHVFHIIIQYNIPMLLESPGTGNNIVGEVWKIDQTKLEHLGKYSS